MGSGQLHVHHFLVRGRSTFSQTQGKALKRKKETTHEGKVKRSGEKIKIITNIATAHLMAVLPW